MRAILVTVGAVVLSTSAMAKDCWEGSSEILTATDWAVTIVDQSSVKGMDIAVELKNNGAKAMRMVDATYRFEDGLGRSISTFTVNPDLRAKPNETVETATGYMGTEMDRVPTMAREDVKVIVCTKSVVYEDGTKEEFK